MSKWTKANEYVPVTKGSTAVITLQSDGDIYGYMDASATGVLLASASAGIAKIPTGSFSKITCTAPFILTTESAMSRLRGGQGQNGGGGTTDAYVTWGGVNNTEVTLNIPDDVDIPLTFNLCEQITSIKGNAGGKTNFKAFCNAAYNLNHFDLIMNNASDCNSLLCSTEKLKSVTLNLPNAIDATDLVSYSTWLEEAYIYIPLATQSRDLLTYCQKLKTLTLIAPLITDFSVGTNSNLTSITINIASINTFTATAVRTLVNVTILEGGLSSCTSFNISTSTSLTDESIQNIIDALPDYSGTETSALVTFPSGRLSTEQQEAITAKGWTWA